MAISMLKIRRPLGRLIFNMGIAIPGKTVFLIETAPRLFENHEQNWTPDISKVYQAVRAMLFPGQIVFSLTENPSLNINHAGM